METLTSLVSGLLPGIWGYVIAGVTGLAAIFGLYLKGRSDQKTKTKLREAEKFNKTAKAIDDVDEITDATDAREFLRNRRKR